MPSNSTRTDITVSIGARVQNRVLVLLLATARIATVGSETIGASGDKVWHTRCAKQPPIDVVFKSIQCRYVSAARLEWFAGRRDRHRRHRGPDGVAAMPGAAEGNDETLGWVNMSCARQHGLDGISSDMRKEEALRIHYGVAYS